ncbi:MAG: anhydro-N-acetylmuramic acid kinase [Prolixibacteraceae bacterium]|nr:anhydro-N-acetylmuramic acid kinase [Prolixibacteraceae bacterium]
MKQVFTNKYRVIGLMSGTSLDGLDILGAEFTKSDNKWHYKILAAETVNYSDTWQNSLKGAHSLSGKELLKLHNEYGRLTGMLVNSFIKANSFYPVLIASHGHTVFHQPGEGVTFQLGNGVVIAKETQTITVADFRQGDVILGGQGAPLVPAGDRLLFADYSFCLNLGGFANISFERDNKRIAFDICPVNFILNYLANIKDMPFDKNGESGRSGKTDLKLLSFLNGIDYYHQQPPKSLSREWAEELFIPLLTESEIPVNDKLRTVYEHIAIQISRIFKDSRKSVLITGGGAFNRFLIERIRKHAAMELVIPENKLIKYKEALVFGFLGLLRYLGEINCYSSVTGAKRDTSAGIIFHS